jgi:tetratricopeptide (TPR) repeat protein
MITRWPYDARGWYLLGLAGNEDARTNFNHSIELNRTFAPPWRGLGKLDSEAGDHELAIADYKESLKRVIIYLLQQKHHLEIEENPIFGLLFSCTLFRVARLKFS